jgi:hypothetical protein
MAILERFRSERTQRLVDYAQAASDEAVMIYDETVYVELVVVDEWLGGSP